MEVKSPEVAARERVGPWEAETVAGSGSKDCVVTLVERKTGKPFDPEWAKTA